MAVFRIHGTANEIVWTLHREASISGGIGDAIAESPVTFADTTAALNAVAEVRSVAPGAQVVIDQALEVLSEGNVRVGTPRVVPRRVPSTPLASPSSLATEIDTDSNEEDDDGETTLVATAPQSRRLPPAGGSTRSRTTRTSKARPPSAKPRSGR